jgi:hypothetical protein
MKFLYKISILLLIITSFACNNELKISQNENIWIKVENTQEGIQFSFDYIPAETTLIAIYVYNDGDYSNLAMTEITGERLEKLKSYNTIICPFIQNGFKNNISVRFIGDIENNISEIARIDREITVDNNIQYYNYAQTEIRLSEEQFFSENVDYNNQNFRQMVTIFIDETSDYNELLNNYFISKLLEKYSNMALNFSLKNLSDYNIAQNEFLAEFNIFKMLRLS